MTVPHTGVVSTKMKNLGRERDPLSHSILAPFLKKTKAISLRNPHSLLRFLSITISISRTGFYTVMDTSKPAFFVNGGSLPMHVRKRVRIVIQVVGPDRGAVIGKSTDDHQIAVKGTPPSSLTSFVEVIGIADTDKSVQAEIWTNFGDAFDTYSYNQLCQLANGEFKHLFL